MFLISRSSLDKLKSRAERERVRNIETVVGKLKDPLFPVKDLDMIIMVYVLHHLDEPVDFVKDIKPFLETKCVTCHHPESRLTSLSFEKLYILDLVLKDKRGGKKKGRRIEVVRMD